MKEDKKSTKKMVRIRMFKRVFRLDLLFAYKTEIKISWNYCLLFNAF